MKQPKQNFTRDLNLQIKKRVSQISNPNFIKSYQTFHENDEVVKTLEMDDVIGFKIRISGKKTNHFQVPIKQFKIIRYDTTDKQNSGSGKENIDGGGIA